MKLNEMEDENPAVAERWREVMSHNIGVIHAAPSVSHEDGLVLTLDPDDADTWGIHPVLLISSDATVAEYMVERPYRYATFTELLTAASVRTAIN